MRYRYEIQTRAGGIVNGEVEAETLVEASNLVRTQDGYLLNIAPVTGMTASGFISRLREIRVESAPGLKEVRAFTKQLSVMMKAGISIREAMEDIAEQAENLQFRKILRQIKVDVESGTPFSAALGKHPKVFDPIFADMIRASELTGTMAHMLERIVAYLTQQAETRSMVRGAMIYPAVLFTMSITAVIFLLTWVLPKFMTVFAGKEHLLPKPTKMLLAMSDFLRNQWYILVALLLVAIVAFVITLRTKKGRRAWDLFKLRAPVFARMNRAVCITRSLQTMGELVTAGVPMMETLEITAEISGNIRYKEMWLHVQESVKEGTRLVKPLQEENMLPKSVVRMIAAGEESGKLGEVLLDVSEYYAKELKDTIKAVTGLLEPAMIVFMGFVVGFIAMSIILPVFKMSSMQK